MTEKPEVDFEKVLSDSGMPTTEAEITTVFKETVKAEGFITNTSRMSPFWRLISKIVTTPVLWLQDALINVVLRNMFVATATGSMLRLLAWAVNITPKPASAAAGVLRFYKVSAADEIAIPAGTLIQTERINGVVYVLAVDEDTTLAAGVESGLVPVTATGTGSGFNLAPGYYRILPVAVAGIASAVNEDDWLITPGADEESDDELRDRTRNQFNLVGNYHTDAIYRSMIAGVVGLSIDRIFFLHDAPRGRAQQMPTCCWIAGKHRSPLLMRLTITSTHRATTATAMICSALRCRKRHTRWRLRCMWKAKKIWSRKN